MPEYKNTEMFNLIDEYIHHARDRRVMKDRLINGYALRHWPRSMKCPSPR